jgi:hypothetical protein
LADLELTAFTVQGPVSLRSSGKPGERELVLQLPPGGQGELVLPQDEAAELPEVASPAPAGHRRFKLPTGGRITLNLKHA